METLGIFYQHRIDPKTPIESVAETVAQLIKEGKVLGFGLCEVNTETIRRAHAVCPITAIQSEYHIMHRNVEFSGVLKVCEELNIGFVPYSPLNRGFLGGAINEYTQFDPNNDNRQTLPRFQPNAIRENTRWCSPTVSGNFLKPGKQPPTGAKASKTFFCAAIFRYIW